MANSEAGAMNPVAGVEVKEELSGVEGNGVFAAANSSSQQNGGEREVVAAADHGFTRPEMYSQPLVGTVSHYERHVFLCYKEPATWPAQVEAADFDRLPRYLVAALRARKNDMPKKTRLTICEGRDGPDSSSGDVLIFPDMLRYRGLTHFDVDTFVEDVLVNGKEWVGSKPESLGGSHIFVCAHGSRDARCGACGPVLIEKLQEEINMRGLDTQIFVRPCSHIGGHKYAGNLIVYSSTETGAVSGHWYGYVAPVDVPLILDQHIGKGEIIDRLWRGQMGFNEADQKQAQQNRLGGAEKKDYARTGGQEQADPSNGSACCQAVAPIEPVVEGHGQSVHQLTPTYSSLGTRDGHLLFPLSDDEGSDDEPEHRFKVWGSRYITFPKWTESWEREDTHAVLAVLGAAAAVALAVHLYKNSR